MPVVNDRVGGWRIDLEDFASIDRYTPDDAVMAMRGHYKEITLDPRKAMRVENQQSLGSCQGHSISSVCEWCYVIESGGNTDLQLSRAYGYYETQRLDGISGDKGSTIDGGVRLAMEYGICEESLWQYQSVYNPARPRPIEELRANAAKYKIGNKYNLKSYEAIRTFLGSGQGAVHLGIMWNSSVDTALVNSYSQSRGGGHAIGLYSLSERKDAQGRPYLWMMNSWGKNWGNGGWSEWAPVAVELMLRTQFSTFIGLSDMPSVKPREWTLEDSKRTAKWWKKGVV